MRAIVRFSAVTLLLLASACTSIGRVPAGPVPLGGGHQVTTSRDWSDISALMPQRQSNVRVLTLDGPLLNRLYLAQGLAPGQGLIKRISKEKPAPTFRSDMSPTEVVEFVTDSVVALGYQRVDTSRLRPGTFGGAQALRFELSAQTDSGLDVAGTAQAAVAGGKLYLILFLAPKEHYFAATEGEIEALLKSAA